LSRPQRTDSFGIIAGEKEVAGAADAAVVASASQLESFSPIRWASISSRSESWLQALLNTTEVVFISIAGTYSCQKQLNAIT
jgi:hypothetical protein